MIHTVVLYEQSIIFMTTIFSMIFIYIGIVLKHFDDYGFFQHILIWIIKMAVITKMYY